MSNLSTFNFNQSQVRVITLNGESWFVAKDIAAVLDYVDPSMMLKHTDEEDKQTINPQKLDSIKTTETFGSNTFKLSVINESGLYACILSSHKPEAKVFKRWVTAEVLPSIRKTGGYFDLPKDYLSALKALVANEEQKLELLAKNEVLKTQAGFYAGKLTEAEDVLQTYRAITSDESCLSMKQVADALNIRRLGRNNLIKYLKEKNFLVQNAPVPYRRVLEADQAIVITTTWEDNAGNVRSAQATRLTFKGLSWLVKTLIKDGYNVQTTAAQIWDTYNAVADVEVIEDETDLALSTL